MSLEPLPHKPDTDYQCVICLELPVQSVICANCRHIMCWFHIREFKESRCPYCRVTPFYMMYEAEIQKKIEERRKKADKDKKKMMACKAFKCEFIGSQENLKAHYKALHPKIPLDKIFPHPPSLTMQNHRNTPFFDPNLPQPSIQQLIQNAKSFCKTIAINELPARQKQKIPTCSEIFNMGVHILNCKNQKCRNVWSGRWGCFIGGERGETQFDLTMCELGREKNEQVGWNYGDPKGAYCG